MKKKKDKITKFFDAMWEHFKKRQEAIAREKKAMRELQAQWKDEEKKAYVQGRKKAARVIGRKKAMKDANKEMETLEKKDEEKGLFDIGGGM